LDRLASVRRVLAARGLVAEPPSGQAVGRGLIPRRPHAWPGGRDEWGGACPGDFDAYKRGRSEYGLLGMRGGGCGDTPVVTFS
jgi:hypothetical protein